MTQAELPREQAKDLAGEQAREARVAKSSPKNAGLRARLG